MNAFRIAVGALALLAMAPHCIGAGGPEGQLPELANETRKIHFKEGDIVCARTNVTSGLTTAFSFPVDFRRGSCWRYEGRSGTGKVRLSLLEQSNAGGALDPATVAWAQDHPFKIEKELFLDDFVSEAALAGIREAKMKEYAERWPGLTPDQALMIFSGQPFLGMTPEEAQEAVGWLVHRRSKRLTKEGEEELWEVGKRSMGAQATTELKGSMISDALVGPMYRIAPPSPTLAAAAQETIGHVLTFAGGKLVAIEDTSRSR